MLIFQIKRIISSEKWFNYVVTFFLKMLKIWVGQTTLNGEKKRTALPVENYVVHFAQIKANRVVIDTT